MKTVQPQVLRELFANYQDAKNDSCLLWGGTVNNKGYGMVSIRGVGHLVHRLSYCHHNNTPLEEIHGLDVMHSCDTPLCFNPLHLSLGTRLQNMQDMVHKGRSLKGEKNGRAKLDAQTVQKIRSIYAPRSKLFGCRKLAEMFAVSPMTISLIVNNKVWSTK